MKKSAAGSLLFTMLCLSIAGSTLLMSQGFQSITRDDPMYPGPPFQYKGNKIATIVFNTTPEALKKLVPAPMMPLPNSIAFVYFSRLNVKHGTQTFSYLEVGIGIPVMMNGKFGNYTFAMYLDKALGIVPGREIYGFPKKDADITFIRKGDDFSLKVARFDVPIITATVKLKEKVQPDTATPNLPWFNLKIIPSVVKGAPPEVKQITSTLTRETNTDVMYKAEGTVQFKSSEYDKVGELPIVKIIAVQYTEGDMILDYGEVIHDYLKKNNQ